MEEDAAYHLMKANEAYVRQKYDEAARHFTLVREFDPDNEDGLYGLGAAQFMRGYNEDAYDLLTRVVQQNPNHMDARITLGKVLTQLKLYDPALRELQTVTRQEPNNSESHFAIAQIHLHRKQIKLASEEFAIARQIASDNTAIESEEVNLAYELKDYAAALRGYERMVEHDPEDISALCNCGICCYHLRRYAEAEGFLTRNLAQRTDYFSLMWRGFVAQKVRNLCLAEEMYRAALAIQPRSDWASKKLSHLLIWQGRWREGWKMACFSIQCIIEKLARQDKIKEQLKPKKTQTMQQRMTDGKEAA